MCCLQYLTEPAVPAPESVDKAPLQMSSVLHSPQARRRRDTLMVRIKNRLAVSTTSTTSGDMSSVGSKKGESIKPSATALARNLNILLSF